MVLRRAARSQVGVAVAAPLAEELADDREVPAAVVWRETALLVICGAHLLQEDPQSRVGDIGLSAGHERTTRLWAGA